MWKRSLLVFIIAIAMFAAGCSSGDNNDNNNNNNNNDINIDNNNDNNNNNNDNNDNNNDNNDNNDGKPSGSESDLVFESVDGSVQLTLSDEWNEDDDLNRGAIIGAAKYEAEKYTIVLPTQKSSLSDDATLEDYYESMAASMEESVVNYAEDQHEELTINGLDAVQYVVSGEVDSVKIVYLITLIESEHRFYQLASWTLPSMYDSYEAEYKEIANSFTVSADAEEAAINEDPLSEDIAKTFVSPDGDVQLDVPEGWEEDLTVSNPSADFILSSADMMKYLMVIRDAKADLTDELTLNEYQELLEEMTKTTGIEEYESTTPVSLEINGSDAVQYEVVGSIQGVKLHYLYTIVESDDYFHQIMLWSDQSMFPSQKELFEEISASYEYAGN